MMRKKTLLTVIAAATATLTAGARGDVLNNPANKAYFGARASFDISAPSSEPGGVYKNGAGLSLGAIYNTPLVANLYFEPGLSLYYNTWAVKDHALQIGSVKYATASFRNFGLSIPLQFGYHFDFTPDVRLSVFTGPELRVGFVNKMKYDIDVKSLKMQQYLDMYGDGGLYSTVDCAWSFGAAVNCGNYYVGVGGGVGMVNLYDDAPDGVSFHQNTVHLTLGYNF